MTSRHKLTDITPIFGLIVNSNSGKVKSGVYSKNYFEMIFKGRVLIRETRTLDELSQALKDFEKANIEILFSYGGDGTHQKVISEVISSKRQFPFIVPLKGGTMNMLVKDIGLGSSPIKIAEQIASIYDMFKDQTPAFEKPILKVTVGNKQPVYGFYFANGIIYKILNKYYQKPSSIANALRVTVGGLLGSMFSKQSFSECYHPIHCDIKLDGQDYPQKEFLGMMISTLNRVVFGMTPFLEKPDTKHQFQFMAYSFPKRDLYKNFIFLARGKKVKGPGVHAHAPEKLEITCDNGFVLDGEPYHITDTEKITVEVADFLNIPDIVEGMNAMVLLKQGIATT
ncbi:MAG: diacylglycerol kinase family protein [Spirochaetota bacterium]|nr:diacylglycerol kinase family protein [Spirochaetota bacterium]